MTLFDRMKIADALFEECYKTLESKGKAYSGTEDALANFKENANRLGMTKYQVWSIYFNKHIDSINNAIKANANSPVDLSEGLHSRVIDVIDYAVILEALLEEDNRAVSKQE